jgi:hypothetical protein
MPLIMRMLTNGIVTRPLPMARIGASNWHPRRRMWLRLLE